MPRYCDCRVEILSVEHGVVCTADDAELQIDADGLRLTFWDDEGAYVFTAAPAADGHYRLMCRSRPRSGTLHCGEGETRLVGEWQERDERGYWSVEIGRDA